MSTQILESTSPVQAPKKRPFTSHFICPMCWPDSENTPYETLCGIKRKKGGSRGSPNDSQKCVVCLDLIHGHMTDVHGIGGGSHV